MNYFTREQWFALPLKLRQRWSKETDYGRLPPSAELLEALRDVRKDQQGSSELPVQPHA